MRVIFSTILGIIGGIVAFGVSNSVFAAPVTRTYTNNTSAEVDGGSVNRSVTVPTSDFPTGAVITDVNISITFDKVDDGGFFNPGSCSVPRSGSVYNNEIGFTLISPNSTNVSLIVPNTRYSGNTRPGVITVTFDDEAAGLPPTGTPVAGTFRPAGTLSSFDGLSGLAGDWVLSLTDTANQDPLCFTSYTLTITAEARADISVTKTDGSNTYTPGGTSNYQIVVSNAGPSNVTGIRVADTIPAGGSATWTCSGTGGATCNTASGSGNINHLVNIPANESVTFNVTVTWSTNPAAY